MEQKMLAKCLNIANKATECDRNGDARQAFVLYKDAVDMLSHILQGNIPAPKRESLHNTRDNYCQRLKHLSEVISKEYGSAQRDDEPHTPPPYNNSNNTSSEMAMGLSRRTATSAPTTPLNYQMEGCSDQSSEVVKDTSTSQRPMKGISDCDCRESENLKAFSNLKVQTGMEITYINNLDLRVNNERFTGSLLAPTKALQATLTKLHDNQTVLNQIASGMPCNQNKESRKPAPAQPQDQRAQSEPSTPATRVLDSQQAHRQSFQQSNHLEGHATNNISDQENILEVSVDEEGRIVGGYEDFHQDMTVQRRDKFDSGVYYREKAWREHIRRAADAVGPRQHPFHDFVSLAERARNVSRYMTRVNPSSCNRRYSIEGLESECYIDQERTIDVPLPKPRSPQKIPIDRTASALFETAAISAKLRNTHKMGGERVKDMDHFVASVETPQITLKLPDIADTVASIMSQGCMPFQVNGCPLADTSETRTVDLHMLPSWHKYKFEQTEDNDSTHANESQSIDSIMADLSINNPNKAHIPAIVQEHTRGLHFLLSTLTTHVLDSISMDRIVFYYMPTLRADACVCSWSSLDLKLYVNVLVFHQQQGISQEEHDGMIVRRSRRIWRYWLQRVCMALAKKSSSTLASDKTENDSRMPQESKQSELSNENDANHQLATGLYNNQIRTRFRALAQQLSLQ